MCANTIHNSYATLTKGWHKSYLYKLYKDKLIDIKTGLYCNIICTTIAGDKYGVEFEHDIWHKDYINKFNTNCNNRGKDLRCLYIPKEFIKFSDISSVELELFAFL